MPNLFNLPDGYLSFEGNTARGKRSLDEDDGKFYARVFGLDWLPEEMLWANGRPTLLNREKKYEIILEDDLGGEFNFNYWFPELESLNGGTALANHKEKKPSRAKKTFVFVAAIGIGALFLNLPAHISYHTDAGNNSSNSTNCAETANSLHACHGALSDCQNLSSKLSDQFENYSGRFSSVISSSQSLLKSCQVGLLDSTAELAKTKAQLNQSISELAECQLAYSNLSTKVKQISELVSQ